jgi:hypothetical protein
MTPAPVKPAVPLAALEALDIRVGTIQAVIPERAVPDGARTG